MFALITPLTAVPALAVGAIVMNLSGVGSGLWLQNVVAGAILTAVCIALAAAPGLRSRASAAMWTGGIAAVAGLSLALTLTQGGVDGVRRWVPLGPLRLHVASVALPLLLIAIAGLLRIGSRRHRLLARIAAIATAAVLLMQPDAAQASAFALGIAVLFLCGRKPSSADWMALALVAVCAGATWLRADSLHAVPYVEGVVGLAAEIGLPWLIACIVALALLPLPFLVRGLNAYRQASACLPIAVYLVAVCLAPLLGAYPVPLIGYGLSPILGYFAALAWLVISQAPRGHRTAVEPSPKLVW